MVGQSGAGSFEAWWRRGVIYQVYPRSFQDSDGDGVGDLEGIRRRLDYLEWLGVDAIWISPIFPSPMADFGYDVADYVDVNPLFGTLRDFDRLLEECHQRGLKLLLDFVPNHTSSEHPWFLESRASRSSPRRDWYLWHDPAPGGGPPNNWMSHFGGSAWEWDKVTAQYYYHGFLPEQPDLNWRNPEVIEAMSDVLRFWLDRGVDGFRVDVIAHLIKDRYFRDNPPNPAFQEGMSPHHALLERYSSDQPEVHEVIAGLRTVVDEYPERLLIGEIYLPTDRLVTYYGIHGEGVQLPFNFQLLLLEWNADVLAEAIEEYEAAVPVFGWPNWVLGNHDRPRVASRVGRRQARTASMLLLTLRGTPTLYYGDEVGMGDVEVPLELARDPLELRVPGLGRDPARTPMQWDASTNAGFTDGEPWLPIAPDYELRNVSVERDDPSSMLTLTRRLLELRRGSHALALGDYRPLGVQGDVLAFERRAGAERWLAVLNIGAREQRFDLPVGTGPHEVALSTYLDREGETIDHEARLRPDEGLLLRPRP